MNKTAQTELYRLFLIEQLPEPLTRASSHLQIFDNYIENTRIRIRRIRDPYTNTWTQMLQQRIPAADGEFAVSKLSEIHLNESEFEVFERFAGREIRKNRYFHEFGLDLITFDVYLGGLWGLNTARVDFESDVRMQDFDPPPFAVFEVTRDLFFNGESLVDLKYSDIQARVAEIGSSGLVSTDSPDE